MTGAVSTLSPSALSPAARPGALAWSAGGLLLCALVLSPVIALMVAAGEGSGDAAGGALWPHLVAHVLPQALRDTALLLAGVGVLVVVLGAGSAWLVAAYDFPGRRLLEAGLLLPMAVPTWPNASAMPCAARWAVWSTVSNRSVVALSDALSASLAVVTA